MKKILIWFEKALPGIGLALIILLCVVLGCLVGISIGSDSSGVFNDWTKGLITGLLTSVCVAVILDQTNKRTQARRDRAIKVSVLHEFIYQIVNESMHLMNWTHPLYHHACDLKFLEEFVFNKVSTIFNECDQVIKHYSALMTEIEFQALDNVRIYAKKLIEDNESQYFKKLLEQSEIYHAYYYCLEKECGKFAELPEAQKSDIKKNVNAIFRSLRVYIGSLENVLNVFTYVLDRGESYKSLHNDIITMDKKYAKLKID